MGEVCHLNRVAGWAPPRKGHLSKEDARGQRDQAERPASTKAMRQECA